MRDKSLPALTVPRRLRARSGRRQVNAERERERRFFLLPRILFISRQPLSPHEQRSAPSLSIIMNTLAPFPSLLSNFCAAAAATKVKSGANYRPSRPAWRNTWPAICALSSLASAHLHPRSRRAASVGFAIAVCPKQQVGSQRNSAECESRIAAAIIGETPDEGAARAARPASLALSRLANQLGANNKRDDDDRWGGPAHNWRQ